ELGGRRLTVRTEPVWIDGDPDRVAQMLSNLLSNAVKYTPSDGEISVAAYADREDAILRVEDNGSGIQPELLPRILDLFLRGDHERARTPPGLGIGLTLFRRLVDLHGGLVEAASAGPNKGSSFLIRLPRINVVVERAPTTASQPSPASAPRRILIIEDDPD